MASRGRQALSGDRHSSLLSTSTDCARRVGRLGLRAAWHGLRLPAAAPGFPRSSGLCGVDHWWLVSRSGANVGGGSAAATAGVGGDSSRMGNWLLDWPNVIPLVEGLAGVWHTLALFRIAAHLVDG